MIVLCIMSLEKGEGRDACPAVYRGKVILVSCRARLVCG